jgi:hypothetical protein
MSARYTLVSHNCKAGTPPSAGGPGHRPLKAFLFFSTLATEPLHPHHLRSTASQRRTTPLVTLKRYGIRSALLRLCRNLSPSVAFAALDLPNRVRPDTLKLRFARLARSPEALTDGRGTPAAPSSAQIVSSWHYTIATETYP